MGPLGMPEIIMIFLILILLALPVGGAAALLWYFCSRKKPPLIPAGTGSIQNRLQELDALRAGNLLSEEEYGEKRKQILSSL